MSKKRANRKKSMRPAAPDLVIAAPADAMADTVEVAQSADLEALIAVAAAPAAPDTLAPVANDSGAEGRPTLPDAPSAHVRAAVPHDDVMDIAFFASGGAVEENMREEARRIAEIERGERPAPPSKQQLARRRGFQRVVGIVVAGAAAMFLGAVGVGAARGSATPATQPTYGAAEKTATTPLAEPARNPVAPEAVPPTPAIAAAPAADPPPAKAVEAPPADAPAAAAERDPEAAKALTKKALSALERGKYADAITHGKASVDADPSDANAYLYWGTALMETGKRADAKTVFAACVESATRGPKHECRAFR